MIVGAVDKPVNGQDDDDGPSRQGYDIEIAARPDNMLEKSAPKSIEQQAKEQQGTAEAPFQKELHEE